MPKMMTGADVIKTLEKRILELKDKIRHSYSDYDILHRKEYIFELEALTLITQNKIEYLGPGKWTCVHEKTNTLSSDCPICHLVWCEKRIEFLEKRNTNIPKV